MWDISTHLRELLVQGVMDIVEPFPGIYCNKFETNQIELFPYPSTLYIVKLEKENINETVMIIFFIDYRQS